MKLSQKLSISFLGVALVSCWTTSYFMVSGNEEMIQAGILSGGTENFLIMSMVIAAIGLITGTIFSSKLSRTINRIISAASNMGNGNLDIKVNVDTKDEIGQLSRALIKMAEDLKATTVAREELDKEKNERIRMEEMLLQSGQDWEDTFNNLTDMVTVRDKDLNLLHYNKAAEQYLDLSIFDFGTANSSDNPDSGSHSKECPTYKCLHSGETSITDVFEAELDKYIQVRVMPRIDKKGNVAGVIHIVRDITERKKSEDILINARAEWEMTFDNASDFIALVDMDGKILRCNKSFSRFAKRSNASLKGSSCSDYIPIDVKQIKVPSEGKRTEVKTANDRWLYLSYCPIKDDSREISKSVIIATDITILKQTEEKLTRSDDELKEHVDDLEKFYDMAISREVMMKKLKAKIKGLTRELQSYKESCSSENCNIINPNI